MAVFEYTGRTASGESIRGQVESASESGVAAELSGKGIVPLKIGRVGGGQSEGWVPVPRDCRIRGRWRMDRRELGCSQRLVGRQRS